MNEFKIQYGGCTLTLCKSTNLVALRSRAGTQGKLASVVGHCDGSRTGQVFNGFEVADLSASAKSIEENLDTLRRNSSIDVGTHVFHTSSDGVPFVPTGEIYVEFSNRTTSRECQRLVDSLALDVLETRDERIAILRVTRNSPNPLKVAASFQESGKVEIAEPELSTPARLFNMPLPADALMERQWHLRNQGMLSGSELGLKSGADARVIAAWERTKSLGNRNVIVAVIDDGFDLEHPDLSGPGKVIAPWDFTRNNNKPLPGDNPQWNARSGVWQGDWHGTACAGVAVGAAEGSGIVGAAPNCRLMPIRWGVNLGDQQIENWFAHVTHQGASVVSCSWGAAARVFRLSTRAARAIHHCATQGRGGLGCVVVFAAGNDDSDINDPENHSNHPHGAYSNGFALHPDVIAVAASNSRDEKSNYSNHGAAISVCAPSSGAGGRGVLTSDVMGTFVRDSHIIEAGYSAGAFTYSFGGTSSSAPLVAGIAALILSIKPDLSAAEVKNLLQESARKIGPESSYDAKGHSPLFGYGCVDADHAAKLVLSQSKKSDSAARHRRRR